MAGKTVFLSYTLGPSTPAYGGDKGMVEIKQIRSIDNGDTSNNSSFSFPGHIGTHIDFPFHFSNEGKKGNEYPASFWIFNKIGFLECMIDKVEENLQRVPADIEMLILKTGFGAKRNEREYWAEQPVIPATLAGEFKKRFPALRVFGFDLISMTSKLDRPEGKKAHIAFLLDNDILVLEDMKLDELNRTPERVVIAPLQMENVDGVPCTVIAQCG